MHTNPINLVTIYFIDGSAYEIKGDFEDLVSKVKSENEPFLSFTLANDKEMFVVKNTISRIINS